MPCRGGRTPAHGVWVRVFAHGAGVVSRVTARPERALYNNFIPQSAPPILGKAWRLYSCIRSAMTSDQAAQLIDNTLDLVHQRLQDLEALALPEEHRALAAEFREWRQPVGGAIDLMIFPGLSNS
jgi:hypothetical protein